MKNTKNTKKALLASVLSMMLCISMLIGSTFAWFTDSVTSGVNKIVAGNLDVELEYAVLNEDGSVKEWKSVEDKSLFDETAFWEPGYTQVVYLKVSNAGTLALKYKLSVNSVKETIGTNVNGDELKLSEHLVFGQVETKELTTYATREEAWAAVESKKGLNNYSKENTLTAGAEEYVALVVYMPTTVGNEANYRGEVVPTIELGIGLVATQASVSNEKDSFDENYDAKATFNVATSEALVEALGQAKAGDEIAVAEGKYEMPEEYAIPEGVTITGVPGTVLYLNGGRKDAPANPETGITQGMLLKNDNITISNVTIDGNIDNAISHSNYASYNSLIRITGNNVTLDNVTISSDTNDSPIVIASTKGDDNVITIKNCNITAAFKAIHIVDGTKGTINIENCNIDGIYTVNVNTASKLKLSVKNSVLNGWTSYGTSVILAEFNNCEFGVGHDQNTFIPYSDTVLTNCTFNGTKILAGRGKPGFKYEFIDCKYSGTVVTPENIKTTITTDSDIWEYATCYVNGVQIPNN